MLWKNTHKAYRKIKKAKNILLVTHDRPDGDGLSSVCALAELLSSLNKKYTAFCLDSPPDNFSFLPNIEKFTNTLTNFKKYDLIIALDCGHINRTNLTSEINSREAYQYVIEFDHHPKMIDYADLEIRDEKLSSTAEILYNFLKDNSLEINKKIATCLLTGLTTDTNNFIYPITTDKTIKIASKLLALGARLPNILENTWKNKKFNTMKLWGEAIKNLKINPNYNIAYSFLPKTSIDEYGATEEELEGIANFLSNLDDVNMLLFFREIEGGFIKGSLRTSKENIDVSGLAQKLGGGGHAKASGFKIKGQLEKTSTGCKII